VPAHAVAFDPPSGVFTLPPDVTLATPTPGAVIHYTTDGTTPTESSPAFAGAISLERTTTIRAMAQVPGLPQSELTTGTYAIVPRPARAPVAVAPRKLELVQKVPFDTGRAGIDTSSEPLLDGVAVALREHPEVERVLIEGHADARGGAAVNERLSRERAEAVRVYLIEKGVHPERLEAQGFGASRPLADNGTPEGREANRRVDFVVVAPGSERARETGTGSTGGTGAGSPPSR
jgi:outer membrane protein OmpA-like peptidoglycan-associated protein